jgi:signal transduction histidine kinase
MKAFSSLTNRIFFATALLAVLSIAVAIAIVNVAVTRQAEAELRHGLDEAGALVSEYRSLMFEHFATEARLVADLPKLKAAAATNDPNTVRDIAKEYEEALNADLFIVTRHGVVLSRFGAPDLSDEELLSIPGLGGTSLDRETRGFWPGAHGILQFVLVPIVVESRDETGGINREMVGTLAGGISLDTEAAARVKALTNSEVAFAARGQIQAATLPSALWPSLTTLLARTGITPEITLNGNEYIALTQAIAPPGTPGAPTAIILQSRTERLRFLRTLHTMLGAIALFAVLAATLLGYAIARTITRPLGAITATMKEMAATGDLTLRIPVPADERWSDEDARLLATTFNTMTDSIQRFQREASQRERLSSLGRLSTVVAHEIRNPLMIIKTALRTLRRDQVPPERVKTAVRDIDEEIERLNRIVTEVLDFARPIKFDLAAADLNAVASDAVRAAAADAAKPAVHLSLDPSIHEVTTDAQRLRQVLVNVLGNAIQAVEGNGNVPQAGAPIRLETRRLDAEHVAITIRDRGPGIPPDVLPRVFDPFFTTRRTGTGIGLAISRNIVEGLGGRISVASAPERGTEVRIELPLHSTAA